MVYIGRGYPGGSCQVLDAVIAEIAVATIDLESLTVLADTCIADDVSIVPTKTNLSDEYHCLASLLFLCMYLSIWD